MTESSVEKGNKFEREIADLYKLMGYDVELNITLSGQQVDILATKKISGSGVYKLLIECKYKGNGKSAGNEDIQSIAGAYQIARVNHSVHNCIVVTNNAFTTPAKEAASASGIFVKTRKQLIEELIDFTAYKKELVESYNEDFGLDKSSCYIKNSARKGKDHIDDLNAFMMEWLLRENKSPIVIKGGYGTGKSSFCNHFSAKLIESQLGITPIIIQLRNFQKTIQIESLIRDFLDEKCGSTSPKFEVFRKMYLEGKILIFFDGFDEMASRVDPTVIELNLIEIEKFSKKGNVIVTCRPEYFISDNEDSKAWKPKKDPIIDRMSNYESIELNMWDDNQVRYYIEKKLAQQQDSTELGVQDFMDVLEKVARVGDISTRAVHMEITVRVLPFMLKQNIPFNRSNLYKTYISKEFQREVINNKRVRAISDDNRLELLKDIAYKNFLNSSDEINFAVASLIIKKKLNLPVVELDWVTRDFLNRSFLTRINDTYLFSHKSLGEYLVASKLYDLIRLNDFSFLEAKNFSSAIAGITLELFGGYEKFLTLIDKFEMNSEDNIELYRMKMMFLSMSVFDSLREQIFRISHDMNSEESMQLAGIFHDQLNLVSSIIYLSKEREEILHKQLSTTQSIRITWNRLVDCFLWANGIDSQNSIGLKIDNLNIFNLVTESILQYPNSDFEIIGSFNDFHGDKILFLRIVDNLVKNAVEEIANIGMAESKIIIKITRIKKKSNSYLNLKVINKSREIQKNILSRFFDFGFTTKKNGAGIGLYAVKSMSSLHKGDVRIVQKKQEITVDINLLSVIK